MSKKRGMALAVRPSKEIRKWTDVFGTTRIVGVYSMKRTRARCSRAICGCEGHADWLSTVHLLQTAGVPEERSVSGFPANVSEYEYTFSFLGGKCTTVGGDYFGGQHGAYVEGIRSLRYICYGLNLTQPRRIKGESTIPSLSELSEELAKAVALQLPVGVVTQESLGNPIGSNEADEVSEEEDSDEEPMPEDQPTVCPFCESTGADCEHFFACIDATFATVSGQASSLFDELAAKDADVGITSDDVSAFIDACINTVGYCLSYDNEGGPGMSSSEYWCWSGDVKGDLEKLRAELMKNRD